MLGIFEIHQDFLVDFWYFMDLIENNIFENCSKLEM